MRADGSLGSVWRATGAEVEAGLRSPTFLAWSEGRSTYLQDSHATGAVRDEDREDHHEVPEAVSAQHTAEARV